MSDLIERARAMYKRIPDSFHVDDGVFVAVGQFVPQLCDALDAALARSDEMSAKDTADYIELSHKLEAAQAEIAQLRAISALVSHRHGDDDTFVEEEDDENDLPVVITMKRIFKILDGEEI